MAKHLKKEEFNNDLYISNSQIFTYQTCSLKYFYQYVEKRPTESIDIALPFGSAIHSALDLYYRSYKNRKDIPSLAEMTACFEDYVNLEVGNEERTTAFSKKMEDKDSVIAMGKSLLEIFYENINLQDFKVIDVELPLSATLYTEEGQSTDFKLVGIVDLILQNKAGDMLIVDNKTAAKSMVQSLADDNYQMTAYSYLLATNKYIPPTASVECRFDVLVKTKKPRFQQVHTIRTKEDRKRLVSAWDIN